MRAAVVQYAFAMGYLEMRSLPIGVLVLCALLASSGRAIQGGGAQDADQDEARRRALAKRLEKLDADELAAVVMGRRLAERVAEYAGGLEAFGKLESLTFCETQKRVFRGRSASNESLWILAPKAHRARWELPAAMAEAPQPRARGVRREIMVLDTKAKSRRNLVTVPDVQRPRMSLWARWHAVRRFVFLPFVILDAGVEHRIVKAREGDDPKTQRLRVVWPPTRNYKWVDEYELIVRKKSGRILRVIAITGSRGQNRAVSSIESWQRVGKLRIPTSFKLESGRGSSVSLSQLHANLALPNDVWARKERVIEDLLAKAKADAKARRKKSSDAKASPRKKGPAKIKG